MLEKTTVADSGLTNSAARPIQRNNVMRPPRCKYMPLKSNADLLELKSIAAPQRSRQAIRTGFLIGRFGNLGVAKQAEDLYETIRLSNPPRGPRSFLCAAKSAYASSVRRRDTTEARLRQLFPDYRRLGRIFERQDQLFAGTSLLRYDDE